MVTDSHDARYSVMVSWSSKENRNNRANRYQSWSRAADQKVPKKSRNKVPITPFVKARWTPALDPEVFHVSGLEWDSCDQPPHSGIETLNKVRKRKKVRDWMLLDSRKNAKRTLSKMQRASLAYPFPSFPRFYFLSLLMVQVLSSAREESELDRKSSV